MPFRKIEAGMSQSLEAEAARSEAAARVKRLRDAAKRRPEGWNAMALRILALKGSPRRRAVDRTGGEAPPFQMREPLFAGHSDAP